MSEEEVEALFDYKSSAENRIYSEVKTKIDEIQNRRIYNTIETHCLSRLNDLKLSSDKSKDSKNTKTIKEKLVAGSYNPLISKEKGTLQPLMKGFNQQTPSTPNMLGKRSEPSFEYFKRPAETARQLNTSQSPYLQNKQLLFETPQRQMYDTYQQNGFPQKRAKNPISLGMMPGKPFAPLESIYSSNASALPSLNMRQSNPLLASKLQKQSFGNQLSGRVD